MKRAFHHLHLHVLHQKRLVFYSLFGVGLKLFAVLLIMILPAHALLSPEDFEQERLKIIELTNALRQKPLIENSLLDHSAALKTEDMASNQYFAHTGPANRNLHSFLTKVKYPYQIAGENLAMGFFSAKAAMEAWKKSPTHYANLIDPAFQEIGVSMTSGIYQRVPTIYIAQHLGQRSKMPLERPSELFKIKSPKNKKVLGQRITKEDPSGEFQPLDEDLTQVQELPTGFAKYQQIKQVFGRFKAFFIVPSLVYLLLFIVFSIALLFSLFTEIKKPHPHVLWQTVGLLLLIAFLFVI